MTAYESVTTEIPHQEFGTCALVQDLLPLYLEGEVNSGSRDTIVEHLARCERCASYLAGAQSVRAQLNRERVQRVNVFVRDEPARQAVGSGQRLAALVAALGLCALGGIASLVMWGGLKEHGPAMFFVGLVIGCASFCALGGLIHRGGPISLGRWVLLTGSCALGALAALLIVVPGDSAAAVVGSGLALLATCGVLATLHRDSRPNPA
jgi:hypothetical protein